MTLYSILIILLFIVPVGLGFIGSLIASRKKTDNDNEHHLIGFGVWAWGGLLVMVALLIVWMVAYTSTHTFVNYSGNLVFKETTPKWLHSLYLIIENFGTLLGAIVGFGGLAWAHFFSLRESIRGHVFTYNFFVFELTQGFPLNS